DGDLLGVALGAVLCGNCLDGHRAGGVSRNSEIAHVVNGSGAGGGLNRDRPDNALVESAGAGNGCGVLLGGVGVDVGGAVDGDGGDSRLAGGHNNTIGKGRGGVNAPGVQELIPPQMNGVVL